MTGDINKAPEWARLKGESNLWYGRFERYRLMGAKRSMLGCLNSERAESGLQRQTKVPGAWVRAAGKWRWRERAEAFDQFKHAEDARRWEARRRKLKAQEWKTSQELLEKAQQMLVFPLAQTSREEKDANGQLVTVTTVIPQRWTMRDAAAMLETASKLARLAAGMETEKSRLEHSGPDGAPIQSARVTIFIPDNGRGDIHSSEDEGNQSSHKENEA